MNLNVKDFTTDISGALTSVTTLGNSTYYTSESEPIVAEDNKAVTITTNTVTEVLPTSGYDAVKKVTVTTNIPQTSQSYTWYYLGGTPDSDTYDGAIAFFSDSNMSQQVTLESYGLEVNTSGFTDFKALLVSCEGGLHFAVKYNVNDASNFGQSIKAPRRMSLGRNNDGDYFVTFCTEPSEDGHDMMYYLWTDSTVQKSLAWVLSEYRVADESQS